MAKKSTKLSQKHWLNIIIIVTSAMFLLMVIVGKMLERGNEPNHQDKVRLEINKLDFGSFSIRNNEGVWISSASWLQSSNIESVVQLWKEVMQKRAAPIESSEKNGETILIYLNSSMNPIICKLSQNKEQLTFQFIQSQQQLIINNGKLSDYIPSKSE